MVAAVILFGSSLIFEVGNFFECFLVLVSSVANRWHCAVSNYMDVQSKVYVILYLH